MSEVTPVSVEFLAIAIAHLCDKNGDRVASDPKMIEFVDHLGKAEKAYLDMQTY